MTALERTGAPAIPPPDKPGWIVVGIGHDFRHDDAVGLVAARALAAHGSPGLRVRCLGEDLLRLLDFMQPGARVVIIDAVISGAPAGTIHLLDLGRGLAIPARAAASSHTVELVQVLALARALGRVPAALWLVGVEAEDVSPGAGLSAPVAAAVPAAAKTAIDLTAGRHFHILVST